MASLLPTFDILLTPSAPCHPQQQPFWPWNTTWNQVPLFSPSPRRYHCTPLPPPPPTLTPTPVAFPPAITLTPVAFRHTPLTPLPHPLPALEDQKPIIIPGFLSCPNSTPHCCHATCHSCHCHSHFSPQPFREPLPAWSSPPRVSPTPAPAPTATPLMLLSPGPPLQVTPVLKFNDHAPHTPNIYWQVSQNPRISAILLGAPTFPIDFTAPAFNLPRGSIRELTITFRGWMVRHPIVIRPETETEYTVGFILDRIYKHLRKPLGEAGLSEFEQAPDPAALEMLQSAREARLRRGEGADVRMYRRVDTLGPYVCFQGISVVSTMTGRGGVYRVEVNTTKRNE
ncbi:hypothetical protein PQX77_020131 [Marasmius sp. AFHP31]|nr:hypothetical protein PQX77_020131 [Marasmius sp. AFHP31]